MYFVLWPLSTLWGSAFHAYSNSTHTLHLGMKNGRPFLRKGAIGSEVLVIRRYVLTYMPRPSNLMPASANMMYYVDSIPISVHAVHQVGPVALLFL